MQRSSLLASIIAILVITGIQGCSSLPGEGGTSTIQGKIFVERYNEFGTLYQEYYGGEIRVYIVYGDNAGFDDETRTSYDGTYKFPFLRKGNYTIFAYSDCLTCEGSVEVRMTEVEITENNQIVEVPDIVIESR